MAAGNPKQVMVVVGEASGDIYGAQLVEALLRRDPTLSVFGVAGERLEQTRFEALYTVSKLTGMGLVELAGNIGNLWRALRLLRRALRERRPDLVVLIDFPDFNLRLARLAKALNIPVLYYVSPQVWAWRRRRVRQIALLVDHMAVVFPFEVPFYERHGVKVTFVGHPLLDSVRAHAGREPTLKALGLVTDKPVVALLPGSRRREVEYHLPVMLEAAARLRRQQQVQFLCVRASTIERRSLRRMIENVGFAIPMVEEQRYEAVSASDLVWAASGTATVEAALLLKPMVIVYRVSWITYGLARMLVRVDHIGMANIIAGRRIVPELVQSDFTAERLAGESHRLLTSPDILRATVDELTQLRDKLGKHGAAERVADLALSMMHPASVEAPS